MIALRLLCDCSAIALRLLCARWRPSLPAGGADIIPYQPAIAYRVLEKPARIAQAALTLLRVTPVGPEMLQSLLRSRFVGVSQHAKLPRHLAGNLVR